jgi:hypothetical protein
MEDRETNVKKTYEESLWKGTGYKVSKPILGILVGKPQGKRALGRHRCR